MKRTWKTLLFGSLLFVALGMPPVYAESPQVDHHETFLVNAVQGKAVQVKDKRVFQEKFLKTSEKYTSKAKIATIDYEKPHTYYCSSFVQDIFRENGIWIPAHSVVQQAHFGMRITNANKVEPGDLLFFSDSEKNKVPLHVAIALGNGRLLHASGPSHQISLVKMDNQLLTHFMFATRLVTSV